MSAATLGAAAWLANAGDAPDPPADVPYHELPYSPVLDPTSLDPSIDPCNDLYQYACAGWRRSNPIPPDQAIWDVFGKQQFATQRLLWGLLIEAADETNARSPETRLIGDYFAACMDTTAIDDAGIGPVVPDLERIASLPDRSVLAPLVADLQRRYSTAGIFFSPAIQRNATDTTQTIVSIDAGGIGLPDRDYYTNDTASARETRERYVEHVARTFELAGEAAEVARRHAAIVMRIETALAEATLTGVERRDPAAVTHQQSVADLVALAPAFDWVAYFATAGIVVGQVLNVSEPRHVAAFERALESAPLDELKVYLRWAVLDAASVYLSKDFVAESFAFNGAHLLGTATDRPRWRKCVAWIDRDIGEALGKAFVERAFSADTQRRAQAMTLEIEAAFAERLRAARWMSSKTKREAAAKLANMRDKIGFPRRWRDYGTLKVDRNRFFATVVSAAEFEWRRQAAKVGAPVDRDEWADTPSSVNAFYDQQANDMTFPAAVLLPPLFDPSLDDAPNYGNTGATIGHELTHAFDDEGRLFDANGNLRDWWTSRDAKRFEARAACVRDQYDDFVVVDDITINSALTSGEDLADLGGLELAWHAWRNATRDLDLRPRDGLSPEQRFFIGYAQSFCSNERAEALRVAAITDVHSPARHRVNGVVANMPEFRAAFHCPKINPRPKICRLW